ncbi:probable acyl-activating enzyme 16, chloroplastic isoform X1 [Malus sylvestris]|uniref:probable acyl-activating enzyme 16, chloroplastic isoform X1 n=1 Tax=Malus sylvestris TaxID=3752 RepID=UPI0021AC6D05|nr:probable acyl-activating enzyme 16, chloroplastic isoform X1 [Malus sylvestris]
MNPISVVSASASASVIQMATFFLAPNYVLGSSSDCGHTLQFRSNNNSRSGQLYHRKWHGSRGGISVSRGFRVLCQSKTEEKQIRRHSPFLERVLLDDNDASESDRWKAVPDIWRSSAAKYGDLVALVDPYHDPPSSITYKQLEQEILDFAEGMRVVGVKPDEKIALFADNSCRWLVADQGIMATGAINVVRGSRSSVEELLQIYNHSDSIALAVDSPELFNRISEEFCSKAMKFIVLLWGEKSSLKNEGKVPIFDYKEILDLGRESRKSLLDSDDKQQSDTYEVIKSDDVATLVYTSGTSGNPKGVMLTHRNLLHQIKNLGDAVPCVGGDKFLSMLPPWHCYERACEYFAFTCGVEQFYTSVRKMKDDLRKYQPTYIISVPLVYESLYSGIQKQISSASTVRKLIVLTFIRISMAYMEFKRIYEGTYLTRNQKQPSYLVAVADWLWARIIAALLWPLHVLGKKLVYSKIQSAIGISKAGISGGGCLPSHVDKFFEAIDMKLKNGYGLTETSPVVASRRSNFNVIGSVGLPIRHTEFKVVDSETGEVLSPGLSGILKVRGPQVMKGYYKNPGATKKALDDDGWLDTGDIGWIAPHHSIGRSRCCGGVVVLEGRAKDTIVLLTGENVEPVEIEEAALRSSLIQQIVVIGQDQRRLGAIVVPNKEEALLAAKKLAAVDAADASGLSNDRLTRLVYEELRKWTSGCSFQIGPIIIADEPFTIDSGLMTPTMKIRRDRVVAQYKEQIDNLFK